MTDLARVRAGRLCSTASWGILPPEPLVKSPLKSGMEAAERPSLMRVARCLSTRGVALPQLSRSGGRDWDSR
jgi:hypothetical protein